MAANKLTFAAKNFAALALLAGCNRHDPQHAERAVRQIQGVLRDGQLDYALRLARGSANQWADRSGSETYLEFKLLEAEALFRKGQAGIANSVLNGLRIPSEASRLEVQRRTLLGQSYIRLRKYDDAGKELELACDLAASRHWDEPLLNALIAKGLLLWNLGQLDSAEAVFRSALQLASQLNNQYQRMTALLDLGFIRAMRSQYDEAVPYFEKARIAGQSAGALQPVSIALENLAICHYRLGDFDGALKLIQQAISIQEKMGAEANLVNSYGELGNMLLLQGEVLPAVPNYERAIQLAESMKSDPGVLLWAHNLARACIEMRDWNKAEKLNRQARAIADRIQDKDSQPYLQLNSAAIAAGRGDRNEAIRLFEQEATGSQTIPSNVVWEANSALANLYAAEGNRDEARQHFESALHAIEQARSGVSASDYKITFLSQLIRFYQDYVDLLLDEGDTGKALAVADSSRARILAERLDVKSATTAETKVRDYRAIAKSAKAVLLSYWIAPKRSVVWVITPSEARVVVLPADEASIKRMVTAYDAEVQRGRDPLTSGSTVGASLYEALIKPIEASIPEGASVIVVPDGPLHNLNLETLPVPGAHPHYWIEQVTLSVAPSLSLLAQAHAKTEPRRAGVLLIGNPEPVDQYPSLPNAEREINALRQRFPSSATIVRTGADATPSAYKEIEPERFALIHFAAHAVANRERPLDSSVILSKQNDEYKLYARDVLETPLRASLVTVSACTSAGAKAYAGEGLVGFAWAFLHAGAKNVVAGLWKVDDSSTATLMEQMYSGIAAGAAPDRALHDAKLSLIHAGGNYQKPYYWGPFQVYRRSAP